MVLLAGAWQAGAFQTENAAAPQSTSEVETVPAPTPTAPAAAPAGSAPPVPLSSDVTPMAERVAVLGILNKRNGLSRDLTLKPGQAVRIDDVVVRLRACETTAPWEPQKLTGAFVQLDVPTGNQLRRVFSGWLFAESPSLNLVEHPIWDVWTKSCAMTHPDTGPATVAASSRGGGSSSRSSARNASADAAAPAAGSTAAPAPSDASPAPSASSNSTE